MKFEKFYLLDERGPDGKVLLRFVHSQNGKPIKCNTSKTVEILQKAEIQIKTQFATESFVKKYSKRKYRNIRNISVGHPINIYFIPVILDKESKKYIIQYE
ncbi:MAG: hypothetical protein ACOCV1_02375 [Bacillota bacterium]